MLHYHFLLVKFGFHPRVVNLALLDSSHELNKIEDVQAYYEVGDVVEPGDDLMD